MVKRTQRRIYSVVLLINVTDDKQTKIMPFVFEGEKNCYIKIPATMIHNIDSLIKAIDSELAEEKYTVLLSGDKEDDCVKKMRKMNPQESVSLAQNFFALLRIKTKNRFLEKSFKHNSLTSHFYSSKPDVIRCHTISLEEIKVDISRAYREIVIPDSVLSCVKSGLLLLGNSIVVDEKEEIPSEKFTRNLFGTCGITFEYDMLCYLFFQYFKELNMYFFKKSLEGILSPHPVITQEESWLIEDLKEAMAKNKKLAHKLQKSETENVELKVENEKLANEVKYYASMFKKVELFSTMLFGAGVLYYSVLDDSPTILEAAFKGIVAASLYYNVVTNAEKIITGTEFVYRKACSLVRSSFVERIAAEDNGYQQGR